MAILALNLEKLQVATYELQQAWIKWVMKINFDRCNVLTPCVYSIFTQGEHIENINNLVYLKMFIPYVNKDFERRMALAVPSKNIVLKLKV